MMTTKRKQIVSTLVLGACFCASAANMRELTFQVAMPAKESPVIDGVLDDACWKSATVHSDYYEYLVPNPRRVTNTKTDCMIVYDAKGVYTGIRNWEDHPEKLRQNCKKNNQDSIWTDDCGEIFYDPDAAGIGYYKFIVNSLGKVDTAWRMDGANMHEDWTCGGLSCAAKVFNDRWEVELFIPWSAFHGRPGPKPGDIWTFNHSRYRFGALGWGKGFSTSAPGGSGVSANKFGYLYFSDGSKPDAKRVLAILEKRLKVDWGISIGGTVYTHDTTGTRVTDLVAGKKALEKEFLALEASLTPRLEKEKNGDFTKRLKDAKTAFTNEMAKFDGSFAAVKVFGELVDKLKDIDCRIAISDLASTNADVIASAKKLALPLAGTYDLTPPKEFNGHNGWFRHNFIRSAYPTPHLAWTVSGKDPATGPKILFLPGFGTTARECIEFAQRFGAEDLYFPGGFGDTGIYQDPLSHGTYNDKHAQFETLLAKNPKLLVQWGFSDGAWPSKYRHEVLRRVRDEGLGLVIVGGAAGYNTLLRKLASSPDERHAVVARVPVNEFTGLVDKNKPAPGQGPSDRRLTLYRFGKGRIAVADWGRPRGWSLEWKAEFEGRHAFLFNVCQWALGREPGADIVFASDTERDEFGAVSHFIAFDARVAKGGADTLLCRLRDGFNSVVSTKTYKLAEGSNLLTLPTETIAGGKYYLDLIAAKGDETTAVVVKPFTKASALGRVLIEGTNTTVVAEGRPGQFRISWDAPAPEGCSLRFELRDRPYGQLREKQELKVQKNLKSVTVKLPRPTFPTLSGDAKATVVAADGRELGSVTKTIFFPNHRFEDYTLISWGGVYEGLAELFSPKLVDEFGYRNHLGSSGNGPASFDCRAVPYAAHVALGGGKDGTTWRTYGHTLGNGRKGSEQATERAALGEDWNIYRPEVQAHIEKYFTPKVKATAPYGVSVWSLGDECGYDSGIGFGTNGAPYYAAYLKKRYGTVEKFNAVHGTAITDFAEAEHKKCKQSVDDRDWPSWFDQVQYAQQMYSDTYQFLSKVIKKYDPKGRVGAEGSSGGDLELTVDKLEFWGPYRSLVSDELLKNLGPERVRGTWWGGYLRSSRNGFPVNQWEFVLTGTVNADEWFAVSPGSTEGSHAGDLMPAPYVQKMMPHLQKLRRGQAQLLIRTPWRDDGFAFYFSHPSGSAASLDDRFTPQDASLGDLIRFCYRNGYNVKMITCKTIGKLKGQKVLFLAGANALSDEEAATFRDFVKQGGILVADQPPALLTEYLQIRKENPLKDLFGERTLATMEAPLKLEKPEVHTFGKGEAILLGTTVSRVLVSKGEDAVDALVQGILDKRGIRNPESCSGVSPTLKVFRVRQLGDMVLAGLKTDVPELGKDVTIDFGKEGYVYEVDTGFVGKQAKVELKKLAIPFKLFTQFPKEQVAPAFKLDKTEIEAGAWVTFETKGLRQGSVYRLEVADSSGEHIVCRDELFCANAKAEAKRTFQFPFSDKPGVYKATLVDIATGLKTTVDVTVVLSSARN